MSCCGGGTEMPSFLLPFRDSWRLVKCANLTDFVACVAQSPVSCYSAGMTVAFRPRLRGRVFDIFQLSG